MQCIKNTNTNKHEKWPSKQQWKYIC